MQRLVRLVNQTNHVEDISVTCVVAAGYSGYSEEERTLTGLGLGRSVSTTVVVQ